MLETISVLIKGTIPWQDQYQLIRVPITSSFKSVGPYIFLSRLDVNSFQIYDIKSHKRKIIPNFNLAFDVLGGESFLVIKDIQSKITTIDYDSNQLTEYVYPNLGELELIPDIKMLFIYKAIYQTKLSSIY